MLVLRNTALMYSALLCANAPITLSVGALTLVGQVTDVI